MVGEMPKPTFNIANVKERGDAEFPSGNLKEGILLDLLEGKKLIFEGKEPLWDKDSVKNVIKQIQKGIKVPYADGLGLGALSRRDEHPSIIGKISLDPKKSWPNGYIENSRWALVRIEADGTIDTVRMNGYSDYKTRKKVPVLRKSKNKDLRQIIDRLGKNFTVVRLKHPDVNNELKINEAKR